MDKIEAVKKEVVSVCRRLYAWQMVDATGGNVTARVGDNLVVATPSGMSLALVKESDLVVIDLEGKPVTGNKRPTSEIGLYLAVYRARPEVGAAMHAHPAHATALAVAGLTVDCRLLPESVVFLGKVPLVPYATPGTEDLFREIEPHLEGHEAFLLANHGALTLGRDASEACHRMECLEHTARIQLLAGTAGSPNRLSAEQISRLLEVHGRP